MVGIELSDELFSRLAVLSTELEGFDDPEELGLFVLETFVDEIESQELVQDHGSIDTSVIRDHLEELGYIE